MAISKTEDLFRLIKSLSSAEKRTFRLFAQRIQDSSELQYVQLFDFLDKQKSLNEANLLDKLKITDKVKFINLKRHLYTQILVSLRMIDRNKKPDIIIRELLDFASVLYRRGMYIASLKLLDRAKNMAEKNELIITKLSIIEKEKMIHSRHITRMKNDGIISILEEADQKLDTISQRVHLSNLKLKLHDFYIKNGHAKNIEQEQYVRTLFENFIDKKDEQGYGLKESIYLAQSRVWFYYIINDFHNCLTFSLEWLSTLKQFDKPFSETINSVLRAYHYVLTSAYNTKRFDLFETILNELIAYTENNKKRFEENNKIIALMYIHLGKMNNHFLKGSFKEGVSEIPETLRYLNKYDNRLDNHKKLIFYYKIAWLYIANNQADEAIGYLQEILNVSRFSLRFDIQACSRFLFLMAHIDMSNDMLMPHLTDKFKRFLVNNCEGDEQTINLEILSMFKKYYKAPLISRKTILAHYLSRFKELEHNKYAKRTFLYVDINIWIESKITNKSISGIIVERNKTLNSTFVK